MQKRKQILIISLTVIFVVLAAVYAIDPNRHYTSSHMSVKSLHTHDDFMLSSLNVTAIAQDSKQLMWIGTSAGINVFNGHDYIQFFHDANDSTALPDDYINCLHLDRKGRMWIGTQNGLARYEGGYKFRRYKLPDTYDNITCIRDDSKDGILVKTKTATFRINSDDGISRTTARHMAEKHTAIHYDTALLAKPIDIISTTFTDNDHNLWIGYRNAGYQVVSGNIAAYWHANANTLAHATATHDIVALATVGTHILAGSTLRLRTFDANSQSFSDIAYNSLFNTTPSDQLHLNNIVVHNTGSTWLIANCQILCCRISKGRVSVEGKAFSSPLTSHCLGYGTNIGDNLYVVSDGGYIIRYRFGSNHADSIRIDNPWFDDETQLAPVGNGKLMLFMKNMNIASLDLSNNKLTLLKTNHIENARNIDPAFVRIDSRQNIWLGTKRTGLYRLDTHSSHISRMPFPEDVHIQGLIEDHKGQIWITTLKDVVCYQPTSGAVLKNSLASSSQNLWNRQFFDNSLCISPDSNIVLGSSDGCIFLPHDISEDDTEKSDLCIYGMDVKNTGGTQLSINDNLNNAPHYTLAHNENDITLHFFYPNYAQRSSLRFQYMLVGADRTWHEPTYANTAHFGNLAPGEYTFRLRLISSPNLPSAAERTIRITVKPAPWQSAAAWMLYIACIGMAIYYANSLYLRIRTNRLRLIHEQQERERERHTNEMNMSFFANISHEFRNPLTIIAGPLLSLKADQSLPDRVRISLNRVCISVNRMLRLIDQMLDFNQLEADTLRLKVSRVDAADELRTLAAAFEESTRVRGISLDVNIADDCRNARLPSDAEQKPSTVYNMPLDTDKFEKIMSNLFTNALKHTPDHGRIAISMCTRQSSYEGMWLNVEVFNSGSHIEGDRMKDVFKRYYQMTDTNAQHKYGWGTGIGLYYVKRLVDLHHGYIDVRNVCDEAYPTHDGVAFGFSLPMSQHAYDGEEVAAEPTRVMQITIEANDTEPKTESHKNRTKILVVDDDVDVASYISSLFADEYVVENRYSAETALHDMADIRPDIILSDIIMGEMSGYEFCRTLKSDLTWSHIPVVLITAKSNIDEQISGLKLGAVAYVTKPFDPGYLQALVCSQLNNVQTLRRRLGDSTSTEAVASDMSEQDRKFMDELYVLMEKRSAEFELNVATICHDLLISQSKFNYKLKELTGETPGSFFRHYKLNRAAQLLREGKHNVSEVAVMTGFGTAAHFSVAFKKQFGVVPSEY